MSSYIRNTKRPDTGEFEEAFWVDDYFKHHHYGVIFADGTIVDPRATELESNDEHPGKLKWDDFPASAKRDSNAY